MFENERIDMRVKYTRTWTYEALLTLMKYKTFQEITISEIIKKAGISRATFYRNFHSKEDIVVLQVKSFFTSFYQDLLSYFKEQNIEDEEILIRSFFQRIDEEEKLIDTVIQTNLEYLMVDGIKDIITTHAKQFYERVSSNPITEAYTMDIVASSAWTLLSRWQKSGKQESPLRLVQIYLSAFKNVYLALFDDKALIE